MCNQCLPVPELGKAYIIKIHSTKPCYKSYLSISRSRHPSKFLPCLLHHWTTSIYLGPWTTIPVTWEVLWSSCITSIYLITPQYQTKNSSSVIRIHNHSLFTIPTEICLPIAYCIMVTLCPGTCKETSWCLWALFLTASTRGNSGLRQAFTCIAFTPTPKYHPPSPQLLVHHFSQRNLKYLSQKSIVRDTLYRDIWCLPIKSSCYHTSLKYPNNYTIAIHYNCNCWHTPLPNNKL